MTSSRSNLAIAPRLAWWALAVAALALTLAALPGYLRAVQAGTFLEVPLAERGAWSLANVVNVAFALLLLKPAYNTFFAFFGFALAAAMGSNATLDIRSDQNKAL